MSTVKEVLRLKYLGNLSNRNIGTLGIASKSTVSNFTSRFANSGLDIHQALKMQEKQLVSLTQAIRKEDRQTTP